MNNILIEITKSFETGYEKTIIYKDGKVNFEMLKDGIISNESKTMNNVNELELQLNNAYGIMSFIYDNVEPESYPRFKISYNDLVLYDFSLYIEIFMMVKNDQIRKLTVFDKYEQQKEIIEQNKRIEKSIKLLDEMEKQKNEIDISDIQNDNIDNKREIIKFNFGQKLNLEMGESRFFSDTIDISSDIQIPEELEFVGQLNLDEISKYDINKLLPQNGMLYFFKSPFSIEKHYYEFGKVIYSDNMDLERHKLNISKDNRHMILNLCLEEVSNCVENFEDRYDDGEYDGFALEELNKIYGFYTDCQMDESEIIKVSSKYVILLQLGCEIYGQGVTTFLISEEDLKNKKFDNIIYTYTQS